MLALALALAATAVSAPVKGDPTLTTLDRALAEDGRVAIYLAFEFGGARLDKQGASELKRVADAFKKRPGLKLVVEGHANSFATPEENMALSEARAQAVVEALGKLGADPRRLSYAAKGDSQPVTDETKQAQPSRRNERIELVDPDFPGVRGTRALQADDVSGSPEPLFRRIPSYYISSFEAYDSWRGGRLERMSQERIEGSATVVTYRHPDAGKAGVRFPSAAQILDRYRSAARQSGGWLVHVSTSDALYKIVEAGGQTWVGVEVFAPEEYRVTVVKSPSER